MSRGAVVAALLPNRLFKVGRPNAASLSPSAVPHTLSYKAVHRDYWIVTDDEVSKAASAASPGGSTRFPRLVSP